jgi:hypothetical protein
MLKKLILSFLVLPLFSMASTTEPESNVSTLNNQLVKIGEKNEYLYDYKKYNISVDPLGLIIGNYYISGSYAFHPNVAAKLDLGYSYEPWGVDLEGFGAIASVPFYFRKVYLGFYLEPGVAFYSVKGTKEKISATAFGPQMLVGYHWYWDSGLNLSLAGGVQRNFLSSKNKDNDTFDNYSKFRATGYFRAGWAF